MQLQVTKSPHLHIPKSVSTNQIKIQMSRFKLGNVIRADSKFKLWLYSSFITQPNMKEYMHIIYKGKFIANKLKF